eukprot:451232_1
MIFNVIGDVFILEKSKVLCPDGGDIFIKCRGLYLDTSSDIRTCNWMNDDIINFDAISNDLNDTNKSTLHGNICMEIQNNLTIEGYNNYIQSGNIDITCGGAVHLKKPVTMTALRHNLNIKAKGIKVTNK